MENLYNKIKENLIRTFNDKYLYLSFMLVIIFFGALIRMEFALDTYQVFTSGTKQMALHFFSCGRFITAFALIFVRLFRLTNESIYFISYSVAIICMSLAIFKLKNILNEHIKSSVLSFIISSMIILNIFSIELFLFIEKGVLIFSILCIVYAISYFEKYLKNRNKRHIIISIILMILSNFSYQGTVALFIALGVIFILKYSTNTKKFILNNVMLALIYIVPAMINLLIVRFAFKNIRVSGSIVFNESIEKVIQGTKSMLYSTFGIFPKYEFLGIVILVVAAIIVHAVLENKEVSNKIKKISSIIYIIMATAFATILPQILQNTASIWFVARSTYALASVLGIILAYYNMNFEIYSKAKTLLIVGCVIIMLLQFYSFQKIIIDHYILNYIDKTTTRSIVELIEKYEIESDNRIKYVAIYSDKNKNYTYDNLYVYGDTNVKAYSIDWVIVPILEYYTARDFELVESNTNLIERFSINDWESFSKEQVIFIDDTMHLCVY